MELLNKLNEIELSLMSALSESTIIGIRKLAERAAGRSLGDKIDCNTLLNYTIAIRKLIDNGIIYNDQSVVSVQFFLTRSGKSLLNKLQQNKIKVPRYIEMARFSSLTGATTRDSSLLRPLIGYPTITGTEKSENLHRGALVFVSSKLYHMAILKTPDVVNGDRLTSVGRPATTLSLSNSHKYTIKKSSKKRK